MPVSVRALVVLVLLCLAACSRPPTLLVTVTALPAQAKSLAVSLAIKSESGALTPTTQALTPYELPNTTVGQTDFVLRLPLPSDATLLLGVAAFAGPSGQGCLLGLGNVSHPYQTTLQDDSVTVAIATYSERESSGCQGTPRIIEVTPTALPSTGGETLRVIGWGFVPGTHIVLNGTTLETQYVSSGQLEAAIPPSPRFVAAPLEVALPDGTRLPYSGLRYLARSVAFTPQTSIAVPDSAFRSVVADIDGDQRPDLIFYSSAFSFEYRVIIAHQRAPLQFTTEDLPTGGDVGALQALDIDRDGDIDLVAISSDGQALRTFKNDGSGQFTMKEDALTILAATFDCVDLDGDGAPEVVLLEDPSGTSQVMQILRNDGNGRFDPAQAKVTDLSMIFGAVALVGLDYDRNGRADLWFWNSDGVGILMNPETSPPADDGGALLIETYNLDPLYSLTDLDGDKIPDLLSSGFDYVPVVFLSNSNPPWVEQGFRPACPEASYAVADLDGDELPDAVFGCTIRGELRFLKQLSTRRFLASSQAPAVPLPTGSDYVSDLRLVDLDADGKPEIIFNASQSSTSDYHVFHNVSK